MGFEQGAQIRYGFFTLIHPFKNDLICDSNKLSEHLRYGTGFARAPCNVFCIASISATEVRGSLLHSSRVGAG